MRVFRERNQQRVNVLGVDVKPICSISCDNVPCNAPEEAELLFECFPVFRTDSSIFDGVKNGARAGDLF
jgi:hypothetical protein